MGRQKGGVFRGRKRQRGKKQKGGMPKKAKKFVQEARNYSAKGLKQLANIIKPKNQKGGFLMTAMALGALQNKLRRTV